MIGPGARSELGHHPRDRVVDVVVKPIRERLRAAHDVALDVATSAQRRQQRLVDAADRLFDVALEDPVQLEILPGGDAQSSVGPPAADLVVGDVCVSRNHATGNPSPNHQLVVLVQAFRPRFLAAVAVVLLIDAVKFEQRFGCVAEHRRVFEQLFFDEPS